MKYLSYTSWARLGMVSEFLTSHLKPVQPPILILSLPRSGSSWVGEILGGAANALYLREPITQTGLAVEEKVGLIDIDPQNPPKWYKFFADQAFAGIPTFSRNIVRYPQQWNPFGRQHRRLVIKEVNPYACELFLIYYQPLVVFLVRHPVAVGLSYRKLGWLTKTGGLWETNAKRQGAALRNAWDVLKTYPNYMVVSYEDLCVNPIKEFKKIFNFTELVWDENVKALIRAHSFGGDQNGPYDTHRDSKNMVQSWRNNVTNKELEDMKSIYTSFELPWYNLPEDW